MFKKFYKILVDENQDFFYIYRYIKEKLWI